MATFDVRVVRLDNVLIHPNADRLELGVVGGYHVVMEKGHFCAGDLVAYIPEAAVLPPNIIDELKLTGRLAGGAKNRVKAVRLRGELSQGLLYPAKPQWKDGDSVMAELGVEKYEPPIPPALAGEVYVLDEHERLPFDLENIKTHPNVIAEGEEVVFTEKIHGTFMMVGALPTVGNPEHHNGRVFVSSKGLMHSRLAFKHNHNNAHNTYIRALHGNNLAECVLGLSEQHNAVVFVLGEVFGVGVQDLAYGAKNGAPQFRVFAVVVGGRYLNDDELDAVCRDCGLIRANVLYRGPFSQTLLAEHTSGVESVSGRGLHLREGVVVVPVVERFDQRIGRVALKSVSPEYLLRQGGTEHT